MTRSLTARRRNQRAQEERRHIRNCARNGWPLVLGIGAQLAVVRVPDSERLPELPLVGERLIRRSRIAAGRLIQLVADGAQAGREEIAEAKTLDTG